MKKTGWLFVMGFIIFPIVIEAGGIKNAFKALCVYDYFKARDLFTKSLKSKSDYPIAAYGLSILASRTDNHFYNLDTAYNYILKAEKSYPTVSPKQKLKWKIYGADSASIANLKDSIEFKAYLIAASRNTMDDYTHYINTYTTASEIQKVIELRDFLAFTIAGKENTYQVYKNYMDAYPNSKEFDEAKQRYEILLFQTLTAGHTITNYTDFISKYPQSPYEGAAEDSLYRLSTAHQLIGEYHAFVKQYNKNRNVEDAWRKIYGWKTRNIHSLPIHLS
jgi:hypothetical protein